MIMRFKDDIFLDYYEPTIQNTIKKNIHFNNENVELEIIDIDGQSEYTIFSFSRFSYGIHAYILTFSIESRHSFETIKIIHSKLFSLISRVMPKILVGNKSDLVNKRQISYEEGLDLARQFDCPYIECSAKSNYNINRMFHAILVEINKFESNIDVDAMACMNLIKFFVKNTNVMVILMYILISIEFVFFYLYN